MRTPGQMALDASFMDRAIALARRAWEEGNGPAGCVIVKEGRIMGEARNLTRTQRDPTAHGEILAIREVALHHGEEALAGTTLYTSMEPCPMCGWAILNSRISTLVLGARHSLFHSTELGSFSIEALAAMTGRDLEIVAGVREDECRDLRHFALEQSIRAKGPGRPVGPTPRSGGEGVARGLRGLVQTKIQNLKAWLRSPPYP